MSVPSTLMPPLSPQLLLSAYRAGAFPMARGRRDAHVEWFRPDPRAVLPLERGGFRVPRSLAKRMRREPFTITRDEAFGEVIRRCARPRRDSPGTWINDAIINAMEALHRAGLAHSVEAWAEPGQGGEGGDAGFHGEGRVLVGGLYGVAMGAAFFGESMFSDASDASKICLVELVEHLRERGFTLLDVQFTNPHLERFGVIEISNEQYMAQLERALAEPDRW